MSSTPSMASRYARALYETARDAGRLREASSDMRTLSAILAQVPGVGDYCRRRDIDRAVQAEFVKSAFVPYVSEFTAATLLTAVRNGRLEAIPYLPDAFENLAERASGTVRVMLETAHEPDAELIGTVTGKMEKRLGRTVRLETRVVPELLGGFRITWENRVIDSSVRGRIRTMRSRLERGSEQRLTE